VKSTPIISVVLLAGLTYAVPATACHRFSRWYYPTPQRCSTSSVVHVQISRVVRPHVADSGVPIPLPDMSATWGGAMDSELELSMQRQKAIRQLTQEGD
jgi:hypothetical protein